MNTPSLSWRRVLALSRKEALQISRDPSSFLIAFVLPVILLFLFGYGVNLDTARSRIGVVVQDDGAAASAFVGALSASPALELRELASATEAEAALLQGHIRGYVLVPDSFGRRLGVGLEPALLVATDGSQPNTASFVAGNVQGVWNHWQAQWQAERGGAGGPAIQLEMRSWFNPTAQSRNFLIPGSIVIIMTVLGALLTSLVIAREWERGTMEALLAARVGKLELLLSKLIPYYLLGMAAMAICMVVAVGLMGVPFRGSLWLLWLLTTLFLGSTLGMGLLISTVTRNQFAAAQVALNAGYMPALMFSGFVYEIASMPKLIQWVTSVIPARYFTASLQTLFQSGVIWPTLLPNLLFLSLTTLLFIGLTLKKTKESLE